MTGDIFTKLHELATATDRLELQLVHNGRIAAMRAYKDAPGKESKANWDAARTAYDEAVERFTARYLPESAPAPEGERFANRKQALNWLQAQGYKVSQGKFYQDCAAGFPALHRDGSVSRYQVMQYGQQLDVERRGSTDTTDYSAESDRLRTEKLRHEVAKLEIEARKEDANWLRREDAWAAIAALVGTLLDSLRHHLHSGQGRLIHLAAGDPARGPELYEGCEELVAKAFNEVATSGELRVAFAQQQEEKNP